MKVLLDHNIPVTIRPLLVGHDAFTARGMLWEQLKNGDLLRSAERESFAVLLTADQGIFYQQNNATRLIALVVLSTNDWSILRENLPLIIAALARSKPGSYEMLPLQPRQT